MNTIIPKIIGWKHYIKSIDWDLLLMSQDISNLPQFDRITISSKQYRKIIFSHYYFRFIFNLTFRLPAYRYYIIPEKKRKAQLARTPSKKNKRRLFSTFYTFKSPTLEYFLLSYVVLFSLFSNDDFLYYFSKKWGNHETFLTIDNCSAFTVVHLHDFPQDSDWYYKVQFVFYYKYLGISKKSKNFQVSSLFKIYPEKDFNYISY